MNVLLDLNYTLVVNSALTFDFKRGPDIPRETYRDWLVALLREHTVILVTVRLESLRAATLAGIQAKTNWQPDAAFFKPDARRYMPAPDWKRLVLFDYVLPRYGVDQPYLALESNAETRAMYTSCGVKSRRVPQQAWDTLPDGEFILPP